MLWYIGAAVALAGTILATVVDLRTRMIPNVLTLGMMAVGGVLVAVRVMQGGPWLLILPTVAVAVLVAWLLWRAGLYGGGDAKLVMAITLLLPLYRDGTSFLPTFFLMLAVAAFIQFYVYGLLSLLRKHRALHALLFAVLPIGIALAALYAARLVVPWPRYVALLSLAVTADLVSPMLSCRRWMPVDDALEGRLLAETIGTRDGDIVREPVPASMLRRMLHRHPEMDEVVAAPHHHGVQPADIDRLRGMVERVAVFPAFPFAPVILAALALSLAFGNLLPV